MGSTSVASATNTVKGVVGLGEVAKREGGGEGIEEDGWRVLAEIDELLFEDDSESDESSDIEMSD